MGKFCVGKPVASTFGAGTIGAPNVGAPATGLATVWIGRDAGRCSCGW